MGANLRTLLIVFLKNGFGRYPLHFLILLLVALLRWPFSTYERWQVSRRLSMSGCSIDRSIDCSTDCLTDCSTVHLESHSTGHSTGHSTDFASHSTNPSAFSQKPPIFIVGHWRSGTTFLYNVLSRSPQFAYLKPIPTGLPWDFLTLGKALEPLLNKALPKGRFIDNVPVEPDSPQEDEIAIASMQTLSFYHGLYFPKRFVDYFTAGIFLEGASPSEIKRWEQAVSYFYNKLRIQYPEKQLLIKNPVYTARISQLKRLYPDAKFIHIYRNPYRVFQSTENFYRKLFPEIAFQPFNHVPIHDIILSSYPKMMNLLYKDVEDLPKKNFIEFKFETFEADPIAQLQTVYTQLELTNWEIDRALFQQYLSKQKHYQKNRYAFSPECVALVSDRCQSLLDRWQYTPPSLEKTER